MSVLVSIIVPCYNQAAFLDDCLQSVLDQTLLDWECIIVNDGSRDDTEIISQKWIAKDTRFKYLLKENGGLSNARNSGIEIAKGEFILPLDADDKIANNYVALAFNEFKNDLSLKIVYCDAEKFGTETGIWDLKPFSIKVLALQNIIFCSAMFKKADWERVSGYDSKMIYGYEDWEFWIAILKNGGNVKKLNIIGFYYRMKPNSMIQLLDYEKKQQLIEYISVKHADLYVAQFGSFIALQKKIDKVKYDYSKRIKDKKFIFDAFCKTFFGFTIFGKFKRTQ